MFNAQCSMLIRKELGDVLKVGPAGVITHENLIAVADFLAVDAKDLREAAVCFTEPEKPSTQREVQDADALVLERGHEDILHAATLYDACAR